MHTNSTADPETGNTLRERERERERGGRERERERENGMRLREENNRGVRRQLCV
jgi:hypothetical protein